ncbi:MULTISPECIES: hypothetical protein [unclassified Pseudomonas]|uniref:hypothetical protein n=1 Tax=unclassified Pseudomonas TaxID=196821 RepID=UPI000C86AAFB|nr:MULTISPECIES: hypothetical protein [unclassified Pseudomonas]PMV79480.1 hypothetical protein C1X56_31965 [Pseudomonas sp. GW101-1A09]PMV86854.1 hypothetical protein C1X51_28415 [Pseudomonas sp. FW306-2-2C-B10A]PMV98332.1 hypothetical protein C1X55_15200 [Pseudomonas sp. GW460-C8]PMV98979.1 hypothetical protein C1X50_30500 [Pseudomonas sp. MPR-TSA4]PMW06653.1 hypothetical protein C1X52_30970 [Pseudomonas sp. FW306-2-1A-C05A]
MKNDAEESDSYHSRAKEAEAFVTKLKGPRPVGNEVNDCILAATAGGLSAMTALALAGVYGERFEYITIIVAGIAGALTFFLRRFQQREWQTAWIKRMEQTTPVD